MSSKVDLGYTSTRRSHMLGSYASTSTKTASSTIGSSSSGYYRPASSSSARTYGTSTTAAYSSASRKPTAHFSSLSKTTASTSSSSSSATTSDSKRWHKTIEDRSSGTPIRYKVGNLLGKGGFAKCYELKDPQTNHIYAVKVVEKRSIVKEKARQKLKSEIEIHRSIRHQYVVKFEKYFEDKTNVYIILEICKNKSFMEFLKRRRSLTEPEAAYYTAQLVAALKFMKRKNIIHRDLKLGNLFLNSNMDVKIGDFGLATKLSHAREKRKTLCGTPNYIAPEILNNKAGGHGFEVDIWSLGVIIYTFLVGTPPFQTRDVKSTYRKIRHNDYSFPRGCTISNEARDLISRILVLEPEKRLTLEEIEAHPFFERLHMPQFIPSSCLYSAPKLNAEGTAFAGDDVGRSGSSSSSSSTSGKEYGESSSHTRMALGELKNIGGGDGDDESAGGSGSGKKTTTGFLTGFKSRKNSSSAAKYAVSGGDDTAATTTTAEAAQDTENMGENRLQPQHFGSGGMSKLRAPKVNVIAVDGGISSSEDNSIEEIEAEATRRTSSNSKEESEEEMAQQEIHSEEEDRVDLGNMQRQLILGFAQAHSPNKKHRAQLAKSALSDEYQVSKSVPAVFVTKWVDYSNKYGLGYQLSNGVIGVYFNDATKITLAADETHVEYVPYHKGKSSSIARETMTLTEYPSDMKKKITLLKYFRNYMTEDKLKDAAESLPKMQESRTSDLPAVKRWFRTKHAIVFRLSNRVVQVNFFDHSKVILSHGAKNVMYVDKQRNTSMHSLSSIMASDNSSLHNRLKYAKDILGHMLNGSGGEEDM